jgi:hypothetical protein
VSQRRRPILEHRECRLATQQHRGLRPDRGDTLGGRQGAREQQGGALAHLCIAGRAHGLAEREHRSSLGIFGGRPVEPCSVDPPEIPEPPAGSVEGVLQEAKAAPGARRDSVPTKLPPMQEVDL